MNFLKFFQLTEALSDYLPEFFEFLKKQPEDACVHFTNWFRVGYNSKPTHQDPIGVYCFPKKYVLSPEFKNNSHFFSMANAYILKPKGGRVLNLSTVSMPEIVQMATTMKLPVMPAADPKHKSLGGSRGIVAKPGHSLWDAMEKSLLEVGYGHKMVGEVGKKNLQWNKWFKAAGVDVLVDDGDSIIHSNEPYQVVFLTPGTFQEITFFQHKTGSIYGQLAVRSLQYFASKILDPGYSKVRMKKGKKGGWGGPEVNINIDGKYKGTSVSAAASYYEPENDKFQHELRMTFNVYSNLARNGMYFDVGNDKNKVEIKFDPNEPNMEAKVDKVVEVMKSHLDSEDYFRPSKNSELQEIAQEVARILGVTSKVTSDGEEKFSFQQKFPDIGVLHGNLGYHYSPYKEELPHGEAHLGLALITNKKDTDTHTMPDLRGGADLHLSKQYLFNDMEASGKAAELVHKVIQKWKSDVEQLWPEDEKRYRPDDYSSWHKIKTGKMFNKFIQMIEERVNSVHKTR